MKSLEEVNAIKEEVGKRLESAEGTVTSLKESNDKIKAEANDSGKQLVKEKENSGRVKSAMKNLKEKLAAKDAECQVFLLVNFYYFL